MIKWFIVLTIMCCCSTIKVVYPVYYKIRIEYLDGTHETKFAEFYHDYRDINLNLKNGCIVYGRNNEEIVCGVKSFKFKKLNKNLDV